MRRLSSIFTVLLTFAGTGAYGDDAAVTRLADQLAKISSLRASYTQRTEGANGRVVEESGGNLALKRPNMFRISTQWPFEQLLLSDGSSFWSYDAELAQVIVRDFTASFAEMPILLLTGDVANIDDAYTVSSYEAEDGVTFVLEPRDPGSVFQSLALVFGEHIERVSIIDSLGQRSLIEFEALEMNPPLDRFVFDDSVLERTDVIDERSDESL